MNSLLLLRKSVSSKRVTLASLTQQALLVLNHNNEQFIAGNIHNISTSTSKIHNYTGGIGSSKVQIESFLRKDFHSGAGGSLNFRASSGLSQAAGYAVADLSDEGASNDERLEIAKLGIAEEIVSALAKKGITKLFPIQRAVLEPAMQGRDMIGRARTGTGKTLAFGIPIMDKITRFNAKHGRGRNPLALCLAPTRELANQVDKEFYESAPHLDTLCCYGGVPISRQMSTLDRGVDVVVGTPGRIIDLIKRGALNLSEVQFVVLDEADQMLNVGFADDVETILENLRQKHQTMMFSATMPSWIKKLTQKYLNNPLTIDLVGESDQKLAEGITMYSIVSEMHERAAILGPLVTEHAKGGKCIVFTQTKRDADRLAYALQRSFPCEALHGDISQSQRERTLSSFRTGQFNILVATDVAARGLDVPNVDLVIHYELPNSSEIFVHRSGRTGRAGKKGSAILIYSSNQFREVKGIERDVGCRFAELPRIAVEGGARDMFRDMESSGSRFGSFGSMGSGRFGNSGRSGSYGGSESGRFGGSSSGRFGGDGGSSYGRTGGFGGSSGRSGSYGGSESGRFGGFSGGRFGGDGSSSYGRTGGFGGSSGRSSGGGFGGPSSGRSSGFGGSESGSFGNLGGSDRSSAFGDKVDADRSSGRKFF